VEQQRSCSEFTTYRKSFSRLSVKVSLINFSHFSSEITAGATSTTPNKRSLTSRRNQFSNLFVFVGDLTCGNSEELLSREMSVVLSCGDLVCVYVIH
jgi:hypothetical protein